MDQTQIIIEYTFNRTRVKKGNIYIRDSSKGCWGVVNMVILFDQDNLPNEIYEVIFATTQQVIVGRVLINHMKDNSGELSKSKMSKFAIMLNDGKVVTEIQEEPFKGKKVKLSYNKRQFYDRILTPLRSMGLVQYDLYKKTYRLSDGFKGVLVKVGDMWNEELTKKALPVKFAE